MSPLQLQYEVVAFGTTVLYRSLSDPPHPLRTASPFLSSDSIKKGYRNIVRATSGRVRVEDILQKTAPFETIPVIRRESFEGIKMKWRISSFLRHRRLEQFPSWAPRPTSPQYYTAPVAHLDLDSIIVAKSLLQAWAQRVKFEGTDQRLEAFSSFAIMHKSST